MPHWRQSQPASRRQAAGDRLGDGRVHVFLGQVRAGHVQESAFDRRDGPGSAALKVRLCQLGAVQHDGVDLTGEGWVNSQVDPTRIDVCQVMDGQG